MKREATLYAGVLIRRVLFSATVRRRTGVSAFLLNAAVLSAICFVQVAASHALDADSNKTDVANYKLADGPFAVETSEPIVLHDAQRNKDLPVSVTFPKGDRKFPVVVFSHGAGGSGDMVLTGLPKFWSSHGYVCLMPTHSDSIKLRRQQGERGANMMNVVKRAITRKEDWENRPRDITSLLDSLGELEKKLPKLKDRPDRARIGVGGHSFGAFTAQAVGGATLDVAGDGKLRSLADQRVKAILQLSGQGKGQMGLHEHSWDAMKLPMMCVTGSLDRGAQGQEPAWRREPFALSPAGDKYFVFIEGANHFSFTGGAGSRLGGTRGDSKAILDWVKQATLAFWDASLKQDAAAKTWLQSEALATLSQGKTKLERR